MKVTQVNYLGRIVDKEHFRAFIYGTQGEQKLVESWDAFEAAMQSGIWFASVEDAKESMAPVEEVQESLGDVIPKPRKPRPKPKPKAKHVEVEDEAEIPANELDEMVFEVTDNFLPNESK